MSIELLHGRGSGSAARASGAEAWRRFRRDCAAALREAPELTITVMRLTEHAASLEQAVARHLAHLLATPDVPSEILQHAYGEALAADPGIGAAMRADAFAVLERDPAAGNRLSTPILFFKGYHAIEAHRLTHALWRSGRRDFAAYLQSRVAERFHADIHPAVQIGRRVMLDHATGIVIGETASIADDVSMLHGVTLGGTGTAMKQRHPQVRRGVLLGAGAIVLGPVEIGENARVAAGSLVLADVPAGVTVAGVPARQVGKADARVPAHEMDQMLGPEAYGAFTYVI